ncbi:hypothetical protein P7L78_11295 [Tistrella bauzanensis]|jgi:multisubunit Na+/H+ antiporter MnhB subunit|uniref:Uncharacterized protein n=2 Tax=Tistrella TaxID=171436 RepID=A0ABU9YRS0_9PROT|nr:hypothetical protein [Tistrella bauzanensis]GGB24397.1 hypothetical protein GCM10011505_02110 [Tistrella bauzanensis]
MPIDLLEQAATVSVRRACAFSLLAIWVIMMALVYDPLMSLRSGAILVTMVGAILTLKAYRAPHQDHRRTEVWHAVKADLKLPAEQARQLINSTLQRIYFDHATVFGGVALVMWGVVICVGVIATL